MLKELKQEVYEANRCRHREGQGRVADPSRLDGGLLARRGLVDVIDAAYEKGGKTDA